MEETGNKDYIVTRSNYTVKQEHAKTDKGTVYERDFMSTNNLGGWDSGSIPISENGFKFIRRKNSSLARKRNYGDWIYHGTGSTVTSEWTLNNIDATGVTKEGKIVLNSNCHSMLDFAYYGSCSELLRVSLANIIAYFPGEIYFSEENYGIVDGDDWNIVDNPFGINIWDTIFKNNENGIYNPYRHFSLTAKSYIFYDSSDTNKGCIGTHFSYEVEINNEFAPCNGKYSHKIVINGIEIRRYYFDGKFILLYKAEGNTGSYLRLSSTDIELSFDKLNGFENVLLNRNTNPLYTCTLDYPHYTENGIETYRKKFTWPLTKHKIGNGENGIKIHAFNIDINSSGYDKYVKDLLSLCNFYDENKTDNLWRMMTHDAIKNLDRTIIKDGTDEDSEDYNVGISKLHGFLMACGRLFDDIKRSIGNIKTVNTITYNNDNNTPDYFLSDTLELSGWEISSAVSTLNKDKEVCGLFAGEPNRRYSLTDTNVNFLKNLKINSKEIFSHKGTKCGIEMVLGLFGMVSKDFNKDNYNYVLKEYVRVASNKSANIGLIDEELDAENFNRLKKVNEGKDIYNPYDYETTLEGLPVRMITFTRDGETKKCIVPWFSRKKNIDGEPYFQMYGGWGKQAEKKNISGNFIYDETLKYIQVVKTLNDLINVSPNTLKGNDIFYVSELESNNYYILNDPKYCHVISDGESDGWKIIDSNNPKILYIESLIDDYRGNNPHVGFGNYDDGEEYYKYIKQIFKDAIENDGFVDDAYECNTGEIITGITDCGFELSNKVEDNVKCWYFNDLDKILRPVYYFDGSKVSTPEIGKDANTLHYTSNLEPCDMTESSKTKSTTIYAADSVINDKTLDIIFTYPKICEFSTDKKKEYEAYIKASVLPYVYQVIPSTTILRISFGNDVLSLNPSGKRVYDVGGVGQNFIIEYHDLNTLSVSSNVPWINNVKLDKLNGIVTYNVDRYTEESITPKNRNGKITVSNAEISKDFDVIQESQMKVLNVKFNDETFYQSGTFDYIYKTLDDIISIEYDIEIGDDSNDILRDTEFIILVNGNRFPPEVNKPHPRFCTYFTKKTVRELITDDNTELSIRPEIDESRHSVYNTFSITINCSTK